MVLWQLMVSPVSAKRSPVWCNSRYISALSQPPAKIKIRTAHITLYNCIPILSNLGLGHQMDWYLVKSCIPKRGKGFGEDPQFLNVMTIHLGFPCRSQARKHPQRPRFQRLPPPNHSANIPLQWHQSLRHWRKCNQPGQVILHSNSQNLNNNKRSVKKDLPPFLINHHSEVILVSGVARKLAARRSTAPTPPHAIRRTLCLQVQDMYTAPGRNQ